MTSTPPAPLTETLRPRVTVLSDPQVDGIVDQALDVLATVGVEVEDDATRSLLADAGERLNGERVFLRERSVRDAIASAPSRLLLADRDGGELDLSGDNVHFDPGSTALHILDRETRRRRSPSARDVVHLAWVTEACRNIQAQSTGLVPADVPETVADCYRLYLALRHSRKPVVTGTFRGDGFAVMRDMLIAVRGSEEELRRRPLAIFDCCSTPPLIWSELAARSLIDCARAGIPAELISVPLGGATAPVTLREMVVQHCAESLSGLVIHQLASPGSPVVYGGAPAAFDMRHGTASMAAVEAMMVDVACCQVGKRLGLPTHAYMGLSDAKSADWQAGAESAMGVGLAALAGINMVSGPGMLDFASCQSLEKLVLDNEACASALRLASGVSQASAGLATELLAGDRNFLGHPHTRRNFRAELHMPGPAISRGSYGEWEQAGGRDAFDAAAVEVDRILARGNPAPLPDDTARELDRLMDGEAARCGVEGPSWSL
ncbi:MAG: hypothetical protein GY719_07275 [bacterium]|nr:hypothetical protein [bacterium]